MYVHRQRKHHIAPSSSLRLSPPQPSSAPVSLPTPATINPLSFSILKMPIQEPPPNRRRRRRRRRRRTPAAASGSSTDSESDDAWRTPGDGSTTGEVLNEMPHRESCLSDGGVDLESGDAEIKAHSVTKGERRDCRICLSRLVERGDDDGDHGGGGIELGCSCKGDLAAAHKQCAETWFKRKGNTTCEICGATALNVVGERINNSNTTEAAATATSVPPSLVTLAETRNFWPGRRLMNVLLGCMIFAFIISWLFHFDLFSRRK